MCCTRIAENTGCKKISIWAPSHNFVGLSTIGKKVVKQQYLLHIFPQYGELRPTSGWDPFVSLGHPCKFQRVSRLGSVTARHSSTGRQPNFAALNRGRHLYSAGRPSRSTLAHISSCTIGLNRQLMSSSKTPVSDSQSSGCVVDSAFEKKLINHIYYGRPV